MWTGWKEGKGREEDRQTDRLTEQRDRQLKVREKRQRHQNKIVELKKLTNIAHTIPSSAGGCCGNIKHVSTCD